MSRRPIVLLPPDIQTGQSRRGPVPQFVSQRQYADAILEAGGLPVIPPATHDEGALDELVALADALVLPGGAFDIDPALYGEERLPECGELNVERTNLERALLARAEKKAIPILGVCGGMQLMNVARGGTLFQDIDSQLHSEVAHQMEGPKSGSAHEVTILPGTKLAQLTLCPGLGVNSTHHQATKRLGNGLIATAIAPDEIVEGFEDPDLPFFVGVQWHPESMREEAHRAIYRGLVDAARARIDGSAADHPSRAP